MKNKEEIKKIAFERLEILFDRAGKIFKENKNLSNRYVELARKIAMKTNIRIPRKFKRKFCKHCYHFFMPSVTCRVRTRNNMVVYYCFNCKKYTKIPFLKEKKLMKNKV